MMREFLVDDKTKRTFVIEGIESLGCNLSFGEVKPAVVTASRKTVHSRWEVTFCRFGDPSLAARLVAQLNAEEFEDEED